MPVMLDAVRALRPWLVVVENVQGLSYAKHRGYLEAFCTRLRSMGYRVGWRVLNSADYGVPQTRKRVFVVARLEGDVCWPKPTHARVPVNGESPWVSMASALGWGMTERPMLTIASSRRTGGPDAQGVGGTGAREALARELEAGRWVLNTNVDQRDGRRQTRAVGEPVPTMSTKSGGQWVLTRPATTVAGDTRVQPPGHRENRVAPGHKRAGPDAYRLSVAELAVLQDFDPAYPFQGTKTSQVRQVGNAVPATMVQAVVGCNLWPPRWERL